MESPANQWKSAILQRPIPSPQDPISNRVFGNLKSSSGISVAVLDASAIIHGDKVSGIADKFVTLPEVMDEVRDPVSRHRLSFLPFTIETMEPSADAIKKVAKFARETGDFGTLSEVDRKLIALTYMLEVQIHGTSRLRDSPPPLRVVNARNVHEADLPGWGNNVPNLAEWEALEQVMDGGVDCGSRVLPLKDLDDNIIPTSGGDSNTGEPDGEHQFFSRPRRFMFPKKEIKIDGKKMVAAGIDASQGEDTENADDWQPAVSRSTHRRYLRRKARRELSAPSEEENGLPTEEGSIVRVAIEGSEHPIIEEGSLDAAELAMEGDEIGSDHPTIEEDSLDDVGLAMEGDEIGTLTSELAMEGDEIGTLTSELAMEGDEIGTLTNELHDFEISSQADESVETPVLDDASSEQSSMIQSLSDSTVACVTSDFAMQNVILQIGLRLLAPGGMQIRQLHRWVRKCHACNKVTQETGRIFCPKCGNGGTLRKVSLTVGEHGIILADRRHRNILRGTKFSIPMPESGRDAITKNLILREDQLPRKHLYPKTKKKSGIQNDFFSVDDIFSRPGDGRGPLKAPVGRTVAMFSGRRNPNDNHFSRSRC